MGTSVPSTGSSSVAVVLLLFGGRGKLSSIMGDAAKGIRAFRDGLKGDETRRAGAASPAAAARRRRKRTRSSASRADRRPGAAGVPPAEQPHVSRRPDPRFPDRRRGGPDRGRAEGPADPDAQGRPVRGPDARHGGRVPRQLRRDGPPVGARRAAQGGRGAAHRPAAGGRGRPRRRRAARRRCSTTSTPACARAGRRSRPIEPQSAAAPSRREPPPKPPPRERRRRRPRRPTAARVRQADRAAPRLELTDDEAEIEASRAPLLDH